MLNQDEHTWQDSTLPASQLTDEQRSERARLLEDIERRKRGELVREEAKP